MASVRSSSFEDFLIISGLLLLQGAYGFYTIFLNRILALGFNSLFIVISGNFLGACYLLPVAIAMERKKWPAKLSSTMIVQFGVMALGGVTIYQGLNLMGIKRTTPAIASAMPNLLPGFVFTIAVILRFEKFSIRCKYSQAKVLGTFVCLGGAIAMSILQTPTTSKASFFLGGSVNSNTNSDWVMGFLYLLAAVIIASFNMVLQAQTLISFPAPISMCVITSLMGSFLTGILQILTEGKLDVGSPNLSTSFVIVIMIAGSVICSSCIVYQTWCVGKRGPLLVSIFTPIQTVCATSLAMIFFGQSISLGSSIGMLLMITGLYVVLWAKKKESFDLTKDSKNMPNVAHDIEKHLLS